jgi:hypothetical protein
MLSGCSNLLTDRFFRLGAPLGETPLAERRYNGQSLPSTAVRCQRRRTHHDNP